MDWHLVRGSRRNHRIGRRTRLVLVRHGCGGTDRHRNFSSLVDTLQETVKKASSRTWKRP